MSARPHHKASAPGEAVLRMSMKAAITGVPRPDYKGSDEVRFANLQLAKAARRAEREWRRSLRKAS